MRERDCEPTFPEIGAETCFTEPGRSALIRVLGYAATERRENVTCKVLEVFEGDFKRGEMFEAGREVGAKNWNTCRHA